MGKDMSWKTFFSDNERYADIINGIGCKGVQVVSKEDLQDLDTRTGLQKKSDHTRSRDMIRKAAFGVNFAIIGIENQKNMDYSIPVRMMVYEVGNYQQQVKRIQKIPVYSRRMFVRCLIFCDMRKIRKNCRNW